MGDGRRVRCGGAAAVASWSQRKQQGCQRLKAARLLEPALVWTLLKRLAGAEAPRKSAGRWDCPWRLR